MTFVKMSINDFDKEIQNAEKFNSFDAQKILFENSDERIKRNFFYVTINNNILFNIRNADNNVRERYQSFFFSIIDVSILFIENEMTEKIIVVQKINNNNNKNFKIAKVNLFKIIEEEKTQIKNKI